MKKKMLFGILAVSLITGGTCSAFAQENTATAQNFIVEKENADTYINPLPLDYARSSSEGKGEIADNPFMVGQMKQYLMIQLSKSHTHVFRICLEVRLHISVKMIQELQLIHQHFIIMIHGICMEPTVLYGYQRIL